MTVSFPTALKHKREQLVKALEEILDHISR